MNANCYIHKKKITLYATGGHFGCTECLTGGHAIESVEGIKSMKCSNFGEISPRVPLVMTKGQSIVNERDPPLYELVEYLLSSPESPEALFTLSQFYEYGYGLIENKQAAITLLEQSAIEYAPAAERLSLLYLNSNKNREIVHILKGKTLTGEGLYICAIAEYRLGDFSRSKEMMKKSAEMGYARASLVQGLYYLGFDQHTKVNHSKAVLYLSSCGESCQAYSLLALMYFNGDGLPKDLNKASEYARLSLDARLSSREAETVVRESVLLSLSILDSVEVGRIVSESSSKEELISKLEEKEREGSSVVKGRERLAFKYALASALLGERNDKEETKKAFEIYTGLSGRYAHADTVLSIMYQEGYGCEKDLHKAFVHIQLAPKNEQNKYRASWIKHLLYQNDEEAIQTLSEVTHLPNSVYSLANLLYKHKRYERAFTEYQRGYEMGIAECAHALAYMNLYGIGCLKSREKAIDILMDNAWYAPCEFLLGLCYYDGIGLEKNAEKAILCLEGACTKDPQKKHLDPLIAILTKEKRVEKLGKWVDTNGHLLLQQDH